MSFGFSVGDFIAIGKLICDITSCLQSVGGAKSDYQELIREFELLDAALRHLDQLDNTTSASTRLDAIKYAALSCRLPLEEFLDKARKYEKSLGIWNKVHIVKSTTNKLGWTFKQKDEIKRLQTYLNVHIGTINILLTEYGLEKMDMADRRAEADCARVRNQLQDTHIILEEVRRSLPDQALLLRNVHSMVRGIHKLVCGEMKSSLEHIGRMVRKVCVSTQQIYTIVLEIRASVTIADTRWTHFQAPFSVEDALGFKFPIPSEYDYDMVETIIRRRFKEGTGSQDVIAGNYELCKAQKRSETITATSRLVPGTAIIMAVIVSIAESSDSSCPIPQCGSRTILSCPGGGHTW
ncbi:hypothetical protein K505DRAFT_227706 [Melanomma pulvis-pyrius CBS 109.77]|uniref:Ubiquitin-like domain-containing protein n=1 Tax=Melanomma pulvis-pyrius CBS 109.77 TaxID=1314802 RepID=A0A6A6XWD7_9PLEO|nr:hypothetical protein K505DRAFT_227706 [Melanomma pulvis-pyrius CBS 109.77]